MSLEPIVEHARKRAMTTSPALQGKQRATDRHGLNTFDRDIGQVDAVPQLVCRVCRRGPTARPKTEALIVALALALTPSVKMRVHFLDKLTSFDHTQHVVSGIPFDRPREEA